MVAGSCDLPGRSLWFQNRRWHIYCTLGAAITKKHNEGLSVPHSLTYIDDGILIDDEQCIQGSLDEYVSAVVKIFDPDGVNLDLVKTWVGGLETIGWEFGAA